MKTFCICLMAGAVVVPPFSANAQPVDAKYCSALTQRYQKYADQSGARYRGFSNTDVIAAMEKCRNGQTAEAIPVLESALRNANVDLPPRTRPVRARGSD